MNHLVGWDGPHIFEAETQLPGSLEPPVMILVVHQMQATSADYYFESYNHYGVHEARQKAMRILCFWVNFRMVSGRSFFGRNVR